MANTSAITPSALWTAVVARPRPSRLVDFPHESNSPAIGQVRIRALTMSEINECAATARRRTMAAIRDQDSQKGVRLRADEDIFDNLNSLEILWRSCVDPADPDQRALLFPAPEAIGKHLSTDEIGELCRAYVFFMAEVSPGVSDFESDDEMEACLARLAKGGEESPLAGRSLAALIQLLHFLVRRHRNLLTDSSSPSSPQSYTQSMSGTTLDSAQVDPSETGSAIGG